MFIHGLLSVVESCWEQGIIPPPFGMASRRAEQRSVDEERAARQSNADTGGIESPVTHRRIWKSVWTVGYHRIQVLLFFKFSFQVQSSIWNIRVL